MARSCVAWSSLRFRSCVIRSTILVPGSPAPPRPCGPGCADTGSASARSAAPQDAMVSLYRFVIGLLLRTACDVHAACDLLPGDETRRTWGLCQTGCVICYHPRRLMSPLLVSLKVAIWSTLLILPPGVALGYLLA